MFSNELSMASVMGIIRSTESHTIMMGEESPNEDAWKHVPQNPFSRGSCVLGVSDPDRPLE